MCNPRIFFTDVGRIVWIPRVVIILSASYQMAPEYFLPSFLWQLCELSRTPAPMYPPDFLSTHHPEDWLKRAEQVFEVSRTGIITRMEVGSIMGVLFMRPEARYATDRAYHLHHGYCHRLLVNTWILAGIIWTISAGLPQTGTLCDPLYLEGTPDSGVKRRPSEL